MIDNPMISQIERTGYMSEPEYVYVCDCCGEELFEGDRVFEIDGDILCQDCAFDNYSKLI